MIKACTRFYQCRNRRLPYRPYRALKVPYTACTQVLIREFIINNQERESKMEEMKKIDEVHKAYEICKEVFSPTVGIIEAGSEIEDKEEYEFYKMAHEFFFQKRQKELIAKGIY